MLQRFALIWITFAIASLQTELGYGKTIELSEFILLKPIPGASVTVGYGTIINSTNLPIKINKITCSHADSIQIHETRTVGKSTSMVEIPALVVEPNARIELQPKGLHLMVHDFKPSSSKELAATLSFHIEGKDKPEQHKAAVQSRATDEH